MQLAQAEDSVALGHKRHCLVISAAKRCQIAVVVLKHHVKIHLRCVGRAGGTLADVNFGDGGGQYLCAAVIDKGGNAHALGVTQHIQPLALFGVHHNLKGVVLVAHAFKL